MEYFIVVKFLLTVVLGIPGGVQRSVLTVYDSAQEACSELVKGSPIDARIYKLTVKRKDCRATPDPEFINCLIEDGGFAFTEGTCEAKKEFVFKTEKL